jgi:outer membrane lipoprotein carrier protein
MRISIGLVAFFLLPISFAKNLTEYLNNINSFAANFNQTVSHNDKVIQKTSGTIQFLKPQYFKWVTKIPDQQIVANGQKIYIFDRDLDQVTIKTQHQQLENTPAMFLISDPQSLYKHFRIKNCKNSDSCFILTANNQQASFKNIQINFDTKNSLNSLIINDALGQKTNILFSSIQMNTQLKPQNFNFTIPKNVDLIE